MNAAPEPASNNQTPNKERMDLMLRRLLPATTAANDHG
jgi:hypothetical protein